jgi:hypothetical protein
MDETAVPSAAAPADTAGDEPRPRDVTPLAAGLVALGALTLYRTTLLPGLGFWDTGEAQTVLPILGTMHPTGFPAFVITGWLFSIVAQPLGEPAFLMNLLAATCAALAAGGTVMVSRRLRVPLPIGVAAALGFALTPLVWHISTAIDAHALHILLVASLTLALLRWQALVDGRKARPDDAAYRRRGDRAIVVAAAIYGVAAANHGLALLLAPSITLFVLAVEPQVLRRPRLIVAAVGTAVLVAGVLYLELPLRAGAFRAPLVYAHPDTWPGFWDIVLARQFQGDVHSLFADLGQKTDALVQLGTAQLGPLAALVPASLLVTAVKQPKYALFSGTAALVTVVFAGSYTNADISRYYLGPALFVWTWLAVCAGVFADAITGRSLGGRADDEPEPTVALPGRRRVGLAIAVATAFALAMLVPSAIGLDRRWASVSQAGDTKAQAWLDSAFRAMRGNAVVISWWSYSTPLWYGEFVQGRRTDITIIDDSTAVWNNLGTVPQIIDTYLGTRPVYVIRQSDSEIETLAQQYLILPVDLPSNFYLVTGRLGTTP